MTVATQLNAHEKAVREAVSRVQAQSKVGAAQFRVDRAARELEKAKGILAKARAEFDAAGIALEGVKAEFGLLKKEQRVAATVAVGEPDPLAPIEAPEVK